MVYTLYKFHRSRNNVLILGKTDHTTGGGLIEPAATELARKAGLKDGELFFVSWALDNMRPFRAVVPNPSTTAEVVSAL